MSMLDWSVERSGLGTKQDYLSWQGYHRDDRGVFITRSCRNPLVITNARFGELSEDDAASVLSDFLDVTGGVPTPKVVFSSIAGLRDSRSEIVKKFDQIVFIATNAIERQGREVTNSYLVANLGEWSAVLEVRQS